jgi:hypothetical protein
VRIDEQRSDATDKPEKGGPLEQPAIKLDHRRSLAGLPGCCR